MLHTVCNILYVLHIKCNIYLSRRDKLDYLVIGHFKFSVIYYILYRLANCIYRRLKHEHIPEMILQASSYF